MAYKITDLCGECGACQSECTQEAITAGTPYKINLEKCIECGACESACPSGAIVNE